jgi:glycerol-3-phosphate dehydrogenase subunit C
MKDESPESIARNVIEDCASCGYCRDVEADMPCLFFNQLYKLYDKEHERNEPVTSKDLRLLVDLCNMCGLCPCPSTRVQVRRAKDAFVARDGMKPSLRVLEDVRSVGRLCGAFPRLANKFLENKTTFGLFKRFAGIHPDRKFPQIPLEGFPAWAKKRGITQKREGAGRKIAYFAGCTAQYYFPDVARAAVEVMEHNGMNVYLPEQKCCGMPSLLEGDRRFTSKLAAFNLEKLCEAVDDGYDIVCSCPTCSYLLKDMFGDEAYYSDQYRAMAKKLQSEYGGDALRIPAERLDDHMKTDRTTPPSDRWRPFVPLRMVIHGLLRDQSYFASLDGLKRIKVASHTYDLGEYLIKLHRTGELNLKLGPVPDRMAYYAPCHLKQQKIGRPWAELLNLVPDISMEAVGDTFDCCGISGIMGLKRSFHHASLAMGKHLMDKITNIAPERLLSDCLSCRIQFNQALPYKVLHPVEILNEAYGSYRDR